MKLTSFLGGTQCHQLRVQVILLSPRGPPPPGKKLGRHWLTMCAEGSPGATSRPTASSHHNLDH